MAAEANTVDVIIAAWNAQATIGRAIQSALDQAEVSAVIVVDDASTDETEAVVCAAAAVDPRVVLISSKDNKGPAAARNLAIAQGRSDYIAVLDADDFFLPARFAEIFRIKGWDAIADNIAFVPEAQATQFDPAMLTSFAPDTRSLGLAAFVEGNISRPGKQRAELGFLKPVISRRFIDKHRIRYRETLRLGEDYAFYVEMLVAGAAFVTLRSCGYVAIERANSLSGDHRTEDLAELLHFVESIEQMPLEHSSDKHAVWQQRVQLEGKVFYRKLLDVRQAKGRFAALVQAFGKPSAIPRLAEAVLRDKFRQAPAPNKEVRYLL